MPKSEGEVMYTMDTPVHVVSRLHAELVCFEAGMDMKKLAFLRWLFDEWCFGLHPECFDYNLDHSMMPTYAELQGRSGVGV